MPRVHHVKKARKDNPAVKRGQPYYWWKFRYGGKRYSKTYPEPWQLTQSEYLQRAYQMEAQIPRLYTQDQVDYLILEAEELRDETQQKLDNMPEQLQCGSTGELLQERVDSLEQFISLLEELEEDSGVIQNVSDVYFDIS